MSDRLDASTDKETSPFVPGARVAFDPGWGDWSEAFVEKVYKTGRFTLVGGRGQQWRPTAPGPYGGGYWSAQKTGDVGYCRASLRIWDADADAVIKEKIATRARVKRHLQLRHRFDGVRDAELTDAMLDQIEAALPAPPAAAGDEP